MLQIKHLLFLKKHLQIWYNLIFNRNFYNAKYSFTTNLINNFYLIFNNI